MYSLVSQRDLRCPYNQVLRHAALYRWASGPRHSEGTLLTSHVPSEKNSSWTARPLKALYAFETSEDTDPKTQCHIQEYLNPLGLARERKNISEQA